MAEVNVVLDNAAINYLSYSWEGPVGRDLSRRLRTLEFRARAAAGVETGNLRRSIATDNKKRTRTGLEGRVGSPVKYALLHHRGTRPHIIRPKAGKALRFMIGGKVVYASRVRHPGTRPNPYLERFLREAVR